MPLSKFALKNPISVLMLAIAVIVLGATSVNKLPIDVFPNITMPVVVIGTLFPGASPADVEQAITYPMEKAVSAVNNVSYIQSTSKEGFSMVMVFFNWGANIDKGSVDIIENIQRIMSQLPPGIQQPFVVEFDISNIPVCMVTVSSDKLNGLQLNDLATNVIEPQIEHLPHIASATVNGGLIRQINVDLDPEKLIAKGVSFMDVINAVTNANFILPSGDMKIDNLDYNLFTTNQFKTIPPMNNIVVKVSNGVPVHIDDVGHVIDSSQTQTNIARINGKQGVYLMVNKTPGANTVDVVNEVKALLPHFLNIPGGVKFNLTFDQSIYIKQAISSLMHEAVQGSILAFIIILIFLRSFTSTLIISLSIPLSVMVTFILLFFVGHQTLNTFTLGALTLSVGRLVDDAIVVLENIYRHRGMGKSPVKAALDGTGEVAMPVLASTVTTISVFFPVVFITGIAKLLFEPFALTISFALIASYFVSLTVIPVLTKKYLQPEKEYSIQSKRLHERIFARSKSFFDGIDNAYQSALQWALSHKKIVVYGIGGFFIVSMLLVKFIGTEFFPETDESQFSIVMRSPIGTRLRITDHSIKQIHDMIKEVIPAKDIKTIISNEGLPSGFASIWSQNTGPDTAQIQVNLVTPDKRKRNDIELMNVVRKRIQGAIPGVQTYFISGGIVSRIMNFGSTAPIDVELYGYDLKTAAKEAEVVAALMRKTPGVTDVMISRRENYPELDITVDREKAALAGVNQRTVANTVLTSMSSSLNIFPSIFTDPISGNEYYVVVQMDKRFTNNMQDLDNLPLPTYNGKTIFLKDIASIKKGVGPVLIERKYQQRVIHITANATGRPLGDVASDLSNEFAKLKLPPGFYIDMSGEVAQQKGAFLSMFFALLLAIMLIYMIMASQFKSLLDPFIIMFSVPMGLIGVIWMLFLTNTTLSIESFMGVIMMIGIVVSNGILLVDYTNRLRGEGVELHKAVIRAGRTRLRPILMTSLATILGLIPMAIGIGTGSETNMPLARAVIGGLLVSTFLTLLLIPTLYTVFEEKFKRSIKQDEELK
ncbi:MAG: efflux RND transporter permease subunit [Deltaproteobacteria bacterium]|nr:efflux RND transporter permease subunit [Deltaproteobacteria bacterium]